MKTTCEESQISIAIIEDNTRLRASLAAMIAKSPRFRLLGSFANAEAALGELPRLSPNVVLMDLELPSMDGIACTRLLRAAMPATQVLVLTVFGGHDKVFRALEAGACGYILKRTPRVDILEAIEQVWEGGAPMSPEIARAVVETFHRPVETSTKANLTPREHEILSLLAKGHILKEIAESLGISFETVKCHLKRIYEKLHSRSRTEALIKSGYHQVAQGTRS